MTNKRYSTAARCPRCAQRAILTWAVANRLISVSGHLLESFRCPDKHGWHVWYPSIEGGGKAHRREWR